MATAGQSTARLVRLLAGALEVWGLEGAPAVEGEAVRLCLPGRPEVTVSPLDSSTGERWQVAVLHLGTPAAPARRRVTRHAGATGLLRAVRAALAPEQRPGRMIVAPPPGGG